MLFKGHHNQTQCGQALLAVDKFVFILPFGVFAKILQHDGLQVIIWMLVCWPPVVKVFKKPLYLVGSPSVATLITWQPEISLDLSDSLIWHFRVIVFRAVDLESLFRMQNYEIKHSCKR